jgi:hypothetical protein
LGEAVADGKLRRERAGMEARSRLYLKSKNIFFYFWEVKKKIKVEIPGGSDREGELNEVFEVDSPDM